MSNASKGGLRLVINGLASHFSRRLVRTAALSPDSLAVPSIKTLDSTVGVPPQENYLGHYYETDLSLGTTEAASDITIHSAICKVCLTKNIVTTAIAGRNGTVKEQIAASDYEISLTFALMNDHDAYPEEQMKALTTLVNANAALYVDSAFLRIFNIDRVVISQMEVEQETFGNYQNVELTLLSDDDYEVEVTPNA